MTPPPPPAADAAAVPAPIRTGAIPPADTSRRLKDIGFRAVLYLCILASALMLGVLFYDVIKDGIDRVSLDFLTSQPSRLSTRIDSSGLASALWGTIWLMGTCAVFIIPVGVATAVYLEEYADNRPLVQPRDRGQHPEPRGRALGGLRPAGPGLPRPRAR